MKSLPFSVRFILITFLLLSACSKKENSNAEADKLFETLHDNQAKVSIKIDGKEFYPSESVFTGMMIGSDQMLSITFTDQFEGKAMLNFGGEKWFEPKPLKKMIKTDDLSLASFKLGKLIDREKMIGEGYLMANGEIEAVEFSKDKIVFKIKGQVGKYSDFQQPDKYLPAEGLIVYKKPAVNLSNITEKDFFGPIKNK